MNQRTLLVTGGAGFIGSHFVEMALKKGDRVVVLDLLTYAGKPENLDHCSALGDFKLIQGDIADSALVRQLLAEYKPTAVINFAAESHVDRSIDDAGDFIRTNITGTYTLLQASLGYWQKLDAEAQKCFRYLQVSTDEVYGSLGAQGRFVEDSPLAPNSPYSASKTAADHLVRAWYHTYGLPVLTTRCSNNYGPRQFPEKLIPLMISSALNDKPLPVYGDGRNVRDWIHVADHCFGIWQALERGIPGEVYCFGGNAEVANIDLVKTICAVLDRNAPRSDKKPHSSRIQFVKDRLGHDLRYAIDDTRAVRELGFERRHDLQTGLEETVLWYLTRQGSSK